MIYICPACGSKMRKQRQRVRRDGVLSMQRRCTNERCRKIKTFYPESEAPPPRYRTIRKFNDEQVVQILLSDKPHAQLAREHGVSPQAVRDVRNGVHYGEIRPDIPRRNTFVGERRFCRDCIQYLNGKCSLGFPEAKSNTYAQICSVYEEKPRTIDSETALFSLKPQINWEPDELSAV